MKTNLKLLTALAALAGDMNADALSDCTMIKNTVFLIDNFFFSECL